QAFETRCEYAVAMEIDFAPFGSRDEPVALFGEELGYAGDRFGIVPFGFPLQLAGMVFELAPGGVEGGPDGGLEILAGLVGHDQLGAFDLHVDPDVVRAALAMVSDGRLDRDFAIN